MEKYKRTVAQNPRVVMIHVSQDHDIDAATKWATSGKFPWLTVIPDEVSKSGLNKFANGSFVPDYSLVRADGTKIGKGIGVFDQISGL